MNRDVISMYSWLSLTNNKMSKHNLNVRNRVVFFALPIGDGQPGGGDGGGNGRAMFVRILYKDCIYDAVINYETIFINFHLLDKRAGERTTKWEIAMLVLVLLLLFFTRGFYILCFPLKSAQMWVSNYS